jgi:hypothetical protein
MYEGKIKRKIMKRVWNDDEITKALKKAGQPSLREGAFDHVWFKIEDRIAERKHFWNSLIWRPWGHPVKWVMAACLCVITAGTLYHRDSVEQTELNSYLMAISNPATDITKDQGIVKMSALLIDSPYQLDVLVDEDQDDSSAEDDEFLL